MKVNKEEILHIANLADLNLQENEVEKYMLHLQDILNFANIVNNAPINGIDVTISANENKNIFRKDEIINFDNKDGLMVNAKDVENNMFRIPKVIN